MKTGIKKIDKFINIQKTDLIVLCGRCGTGKTTIALNILSNIAINEGKPVLCFSLECSKKSVTNNIIFQNTNIDLKEVGIYINDTPNISIERIEEKCQKMKKEKNIELVVIDYLQLINQDKYINICEKLKQIAERLNIAIILISQLSREIDERTDKRPVLSDLKNELVENADIILSLYKTDYKNDVPEIRILKNKNNEISNGDID